MDDTVIIESICDNFETEICYKNRPRGTTSPPPRVVAKLWPTFKYWVKVLEFWVKVFGRTNGRTPAPNSISPDPLLGGRGKKFGERFYNMVWEKPTEKTTSWTINAKRTKHMIVDFRRDVSPIDPLCIKGGGGERENREKLYYVWGCAIFISHEVLVCTNELECL